MLKFFVYGTLKPGEWNFQRFCQSQVTQSYPATTQGRLYALPVGYPAMLLPKSSLHQNFVQGYVLGFEQVEILAVLDELEGYNPNLPEHLNDYLRCQVSAINQETQAQESVWTYVMTPEKIAQCKGVIIPDGCWRSDQCYFESFRYP